MHLRTPGNEQSRVSRLYEVWRTKPGSENTNPTMQMMQLQRCKFYNAKERKTKNGKDEHDKISKAKCVLTVAVALGHPRQRTRRLSSGCRKEISNEVQAANTDSANLCVCVWGGGEENGENLYSRPISNHIHFSLLLPCSFSPRSFLKHTKNTENVCICCFVFLFLASLLSLFLSGLFCHRRSLSVCVENPFHLHVVWDSNATQTETRGKLALHMYMPET